MDLKHRLIHKIQILFTHKVSTEVLFAMINSVEKNWAFSHMSVMEIQPIDGIGMHRW